MGQHTRAVGLCRRTLKVHVRSELLPGIKVPFAEPALDYRVLDYEKAPTLSVAAAGRTDGRFHDCGDGLVGNRFGGEIADSPLAVYRLQLLFLWLCLLYLDVESLLRLCYMYSSSSVHIAVVVSAARYSGCATYVALLVSPSTVG